MRMEGRNEVMEGKDFYISYNAFTGEGNGAFNNEKGSDETALCANGEFYILNGDFRDDYKKLIPDGYDKCKKFYDKKKDDHSSIWSVED